MTLLLLLATLLSLFVPGMALLQIVARRLDPESTFVLAPAIAIVLYGLAGVAGWIWPHHFLTISRITVGIASVFGAIILFASGGIATYRRIDKVLVASYVGLTIIATQI